MLGPTLLKAPVTTEPVRAQALTGRPVLPPVRPVVDSIEALTLEIGSDDGKATAIQMARISRTTPTARSTMPARVTGTVAE